MVDGICIKPLNISDCPGPSQALMQQICNDIQSQSNSIRINNGSYSVINNSGEAIVKILCTYNQTKITIPGLEIGVFFRAELINQFFLEDINLLFPELRIRNSLYGLGGGTWVDYYFTAIDSQDTYIINRNSIFDLIKIFLEPLKYFAYGSNMNFKQMKIRCPVSKFIDKAYLEDYKFVYDGYSCKRGGSVANVLSEVGNIVYGGIFEITEEELINLDCKEGFKNRNDSANSYDRNFYRFYFENHEPCYAFIYHREGQLVGKPSEEYRNIIIEGARDCRLPKEYIRNFINR